MGAISANVASIVETWPEKWPRPVT